MKKLIGLYILAFLMFSGLRVSAEDGAIRVLKLFDNQNMLINTTNTSAAVDLWGYKPNRFNFSVQLLSTNSVTNSGSITLAVQSSNDGIDFPLSSNIVENFSETNSPATGGKGLYPFSPAVSRYIRLQTIVTLTNVNFSALLFIQ